MGALASAGADPSSLWERARAGESPATWFQDPGYPDLAPIPACAVSSIHIPAPWQRAARHLDRCIQMALAAGAQAWAQSQGSSSSPDRRGIMVGTARGSVGQWIEALKTLERSQRRPSLSANTTLGSLSGALSLAFQAQGPCLTLSASCASAAHAICLAAQAILAGDADFMLAGGAEAPLHAVVIEPFRAARILGTHADPRQACRPFDRTRNGLLLGEGAAFLALETLASARRRGLRPLARLAGWAAGSESHSRTAGCESGEGLYRVMNRALVRAQLPPEQIDYINAHGTGTVLNDRVEARALQRLLGARTRRVPCSSTKPVTGHCLGASPALEAVLCIQALQNQCVPPTLNCQLPDPACPLDVVAEGARPQRLRTVLSVSQGFWGNQAALVFARHE